MGLTACSKETASKEVVERTPTEVVEYSGEEYVEVAETDTMLLKLRPDTGTLRWENKETGEYKDSNLADVDGITDITAKSDIVATYYSGQESDKYGTTSTTFAIREDQSTATYTGATTNYTERRVSGDYFNSDIKIRYKFLTGENANYSGMARSYRNYLIDAGTLTEAEEEENAPFYTDILGEIDKEQYFLGIPYDGTAVLTTFDQAKSMAEDMTEQGISNIKMEYEGLANSGLNQKIGRAHV